MISNGLFDTSSFPRYWLIIISLFWKAKDPSALFLFDCDNNYINHCRFQKINESRLEFGDNLRKHFERSLPVYRVFPPSPAGPEFPRNGIPNMLRWGKKHLGDTYKIEPVQSFFDVKAICS